MDKQAKVGCAFKLPDGDFNYSELKEHLIAAGDAIHRHIKLSNSFPITDEDINVGVERLDEEDMIIFRLFTMRTPKEDE
jgi:hypothetical protein